MLKYFLSGPNCWKWCLESHLTRPLWAQLVFARRQWGTNWFFRSLILPCHLWPIHPQLGKSIKTKIITIFAQKCFFYLEYFLFKKCLNFGEKIQIFDRASKIWFLARKFKLKLHFCTINDQNMYLTKQHKIWFWRKNSDLQFNTFLCLEN